MPQDLRSFFRAAPATAILIAINIVVVFLSLVLVGYPARVYNAQALSVLGVLNGRWWTFVTSMFMHGGLVHILCNMISLYWMGTLLEKLYGSRRFVCLYMISGIVAGIVYVAFNYMLGVNGRVVGASGAIFGLFGAYGVLLLCERRKPLLFPQGATSASLQQFGGLLVMNVLIGFTPGIAWEAHFGGLVCGAVIGWLLYRDLRAKRLERRVL